MKIDSHAHIYPLRYLEELKKCNLVFPFSVTPKMYDPEERIRDMAIMGVDKQLLTLGPPGMDLEGADPKITVLLSKIANDEIAGLVKKYPQKFIGLANLPLQEPEAAVTELERGVKELDLKGGAIFSNVKGRALDNPEFLPLFAKAAELNIPLFIHPASPRFREGLSEYRLDIIIGFLFDSTLAVTRIIFSGILEKYPTVKLVLVHLGSTLPYILPRLDVESSLMQKFLPNYRLDIQRPPSEYFIRSIYIDTVSHHPPAYICARDTCGIDKILLGSDYPYSLWELTVKAIADLPLPQEEKEMIYAGNLSRLLRLP